MPGKPIITIDHVTKRFGDFAAVDDVSLDIMEGEFFALLGPSGCGKTTLLRMLAGLEAPSDGRILIDSADMSGVAPNRRPVNMVFQSYAVFPHMSVGDNVGYGLRMDGVARDERRARVADALRLVKLEDLAGRKPDQLSGGQRQRVALARALVKRPRVLLLDEPLSALDAKLREAMRFELAQIQASVGITFVIVTHDQDEALAMASRCALMHRGGLQQVASPDELYERPVNRFVADFIGSINLFGGELAIDEPARAVIDCPELGAPVHLDYGVASATGATGATGATVWVGIRPEKIKMILRTAEDGPMLPNSVAGRIVHGAYLGSETVYEVALACGRSVKVCIPNEHRFGEQEFAKDDAVLLNWSAQAPVVLPS